MAISVVAIFGLFIVLTMAWRTGFWFLSRGTYEEAHLLRMAAVRRILTGAGIQTDRQTGELLSITASDSLAAAELLQLGARAAAALVGLGVTAGILLRIDFSLGLGLMIGIPILVLGLNALGPVVERRTAAQQQAAGLAAATAADLLAGLRPLRGFGGVPEGVRRYRTTSRTSLRATTGAMKASAMFLGASTFTTGLLVAVVAAFAGWYALQQVITIGELITIVGLAAFVSDPVLSLADCVFQLAVSRASAARVAELIEAPSRLEPGSEPARSGPLVLTDVVTPGLAGLSFELASGELVGVASGSIPAADALTELLTGERRPHAGRITLDGAELADLDHASLRDRMLVEPHAVHLFGGTIGAALDTGAVRTNDDIETTVEAAALGELADRLDGNLLDHELLGPWQQPVRRPTATGRAGPRSAGGPADPRAARSHHGRGRRDRAADRRRAGEAAARRRSRDAGDQHQPAVAVPLRPGDLRRRGPGRRRRDPRRAAELARTMPRRSCGDRASDDGAGRADDPADRVRPGDRPGVLAAGRRPPLARGRLGALLGRRERGCGAGPDPARPDRRSGERPRHRRPNWSGWSSRSRSPGSRQAY